MLNHILDSARYKIRLETPALDLNTLLVCDTYLILFSLYLLTSTFIWAISHMHASCVVCMSCFWMYTSASYHFKRKHFPLLYHLLLLALLALVRQGMSHHDTTRHDMTKYRIGSLILIGTEQHWPGQLTKYCIHNIWTCCVLSY